MAISHLFNFLLKKDLQLNINNKELLFVFFVEKWTNINACSWNRLLIFQYIYLIEKGAYIEANCLLQKTPLHYACYYGNLPIVQYLIE